MNTHSKQISAVGMSLCIVAGAWASGFDLIAASDSEITIHLNEAVTGTVHLLEIEPYDTLNPLRDLISFSPGSQQLDVSNAGFLRMTFEDPSPSAFDPQIQFPNHQVNADYVGQFSMRARVSGTAGGADMPFRIYGWPHSVDVSLPADGTWHIVRASVTNWTGMRTLRIDPANAQSYAANSNAVLDIDWAAVTYRDDFTGDRNHTGLDVFIDLGVPEASWSGLAQSEIVLPRYDGVRDRLYTKYVLTSGGTNQIGHARFVTDLSGLTYQEDSAEGWTSLNTARGMKDPVATDGILVAEYTAPTEPAPIWDPAIVASDTQRVDMDVAQEFAMKYRISGYTGGQSTLPLRVFGFIEGAGGYAYQDDTLVPDGTWHVKRITLDSSDGAQSWHGSAKIRLDTPNANPATYPASHFANAVWEVDWVAVSDDPLFTPAVPLVEGGRLWTFETDRTAVLLAADGFKGMDGNDFQDKVDLGSQVNKMNFLQNSALNLGLTPAVTYAVDEFEIGINPAYIDNQLVSNVRFASTNGMATIITSLNSLQDYWLDEGTANQRFNPLRNPMTAANSPNSFSVAHNVMDPVGVAWYRGTMEYLGHIFSDPSGDNGQIFRFTIGNEVDQHWAWYNVGEVEMEEIVEIYLTACRVADLALRSRHPDYRIYISFTHYWDKLGGNQGPLKASNMRDFLDLFAARAREEGDFPWALCIHPYPVNLREQDFWNDTQPTDELDTEYVTFSNLQVARRYLQQESMLYKGQPRPINLGEQGFDVKVDGDVFKENEQAAALAYSFKIVEQVPGIEAYLYHRQADHPAEANLLFGLWAGNPAEPDVYQLYRRRPSWYVMRDYGTVNEAATLDPYLAYLPLSDWSEISMADIELRYTFDVPEPDITPINMPVFEITNGVFAGTVSVNDPQIVNENINTYGDGQETALLRIKTARSGDWQLFWKRAGDGGFSGARSVVFPVTASDGFELYSIDLSTHADWAGNNIIAWRLDPVGDGLSDYDFEIDYMLFGPKEDFDGDGIADSEEGMADLDGDGRPNMADLDSNGDGYSDARESLLGLVPASADSDGDGMDNDWEIQYGFNPHDALEAAWDLDFDGYDTLAEHIADTDPANGLDYFIISGMADGTNVFVDGKAGRTYILQRNTSLVSNVWNEVDSLGPVVGDMPVVLVDTNVAETAVYKVEVRK